MKELHRPIKCRGRTQSAKDRFTKKVKLPENPADCWEWTGTTNPDGYGQIGVNGRYELAHRVSWTLFNHEDPGDLFVLHSCDNPKCVNPLHLFLGTQQDNMKDRDRKGRHKAVYGEDHPIAKLTEEKVRWIRKLYADRYGTQREIATLFGVSRPLVGFIVRREAWKHVV